MYKREDLQKLSSLAVNKARSVSMAVKVALLCLVLAVLPNLSAQLSNESEEHMLSDIMCQLFLGDIPRCPASSCKEVVQKKLWSSRYGMHWLLKDFLSFQAYCVTNMSPSESRGWMRVAYVSASHGCPTGLEPVTAGGRKMCRKTVSVGCSSVTFPVQGVSYSKVCGRVYGYQTNTPDGFQRHHYCPGCTIEQQYLDGVSITHGHPRQHIWSLAATHHEPYCPCTAYPRDSYFPSFVGDDFSCEFEGRDTYSSSDRLWDGQGCSVDSVHNSAWFCKELPQPTTDDVEFRVCADEPRNNEDVYIEHIELYVQ